MIPVPATDTNLKILRILAIAMIGGVMMFAGVIIAVRESNSFSIKEIQPYAAYILGILAGIALTCYFLARVIYKKKIEAARNSTLTAKEKLNQYRGALVIYMGLCEAPAMLSVILFMLTGDYLLYVIVLLMLAAMAAKFPTRQRVIDALGLDWNEQEALQ